MYISLALFPPKILISNRNWILLTLLSSLKILMRFLVIFQLIILIWSFSTGELQMGYRYAKILAPWGKAPPVATSSFFTLTSSLQCIIF